MSDSIFKVPEEADLGGDIRAVLFDAGNTLTYLDLEWIAQSLTKDGWEIDESGLFYGQCVATYEASRLSLLKKYATDSDRHIPYFERMLELAGIPADFTTECAEKLVAEHRRSILWRSVPDYVPETLSELHRRGYVLGVVSNTDGRLKSLLDSVDLTAHFRCIIDSALAGVEKPDPAIFERAVEAIELDAPHCVYVGDIFAVDIAGARQAGLKGVLIDPLYLHEEFNCTRIAKLSDLLKILPPIGDSGETVPV